jgi:hypothetical protein
MKACEKCGHPRLRDLRFCGNCAEDVLLFLREVGYLTKRAKSMPYRPPEARELIRETKFGRVE